MRGVIWTAFGVLLMVVLVVFLLIWTTDIQAQHEEETTEIRELFEPQRFYEFDVEADMIRGSAEDYSKFTTDLVPNGPYCDALETCIIKSLKGRGAPCEVGEYKYNSVNLFLTPSGRTCARDITEIIEGVERKVCKHTASYYGAYAHEGDTDDLFYDYEPFIHDCTFNMVLEGFESPLDDDDAMNTKYYYVPPFYPVNADYDTILNNNGGKISIFLSNATVASDEDRTCNFNLFMCVQPAIGDNPADKVVEILNIMSDLDVERFSCCKDSQFTDVELDKNYPKSYLIKFSSLERRPNMYEIISAIDRGLWEWNKKNFDNHPLIKYLLELGVPDDWTNLWKINFNYNRWNTQLRTTLSHPECYDDNVPTDTSTNPTDGPLIMYDSNWNGKFLDTNYNELSIRLVLFYHKEVDNMGREHLVVSPRITVCRDQ